MKHCKYALPELFVIGVLEISPFLEFHFNVISVPNRKMIWTAQLQRANELMNELLSYCIHSQGPMNTVGTNDL